ncbi:MAG: hypothetical protein IH934_06035 [Nanoarchaeota archaeon]|nr:hypothetical protein [Nanoarchaeota archaeon]
MDIRDEINKLKNEIIKQWHVLYTRNRKLSFYVWDKASEIKSLDDNLHRLIELDPLLDNEILKKLLISLDQHLENNVKDEGKWYIDFFEVFSYFASHLGVFIQKQNVKVWEKFKLSEYFPRTWRYLQEYVPVRYLKYLDKQIPDVKVKIVTTSPFYRLKEGDAGWARHETGVFRKSTIYIDLSIYNPRNVPKNIEEVMKCIKYIDFLPQHRTVLIHEYEHSLQFDSFDNSYRDNLPKNIGVRFNFFESLLHRFKPLRFAYSKVNRSMEELDKKVKLRGYKFEPIELEARLAEFIFLNTTGYRPKDIAKLGDSVFGTLPGRVEQWLEGAKIKKHYWELRFNSVSSKEEKDKARKQIIIWDKRIITAEKFLHDYRYLIPEAERVAQKIVARRKQLERKGA